MRTMIDLSKSGGYFFNSKYKNAYSRFQRPNNRIKNSAGTRILEMQQMKNAAEPFSEKIGKMARKIIEKETRI